MGESAAATAAAPAPGIAASGGMFADGLLLLPAVLADFCGGMGAVDGRGNSVGEGGRWEPNAEGKSANEGLKIGGGSCEDDVGDFASGGRMFRVCSSWSLWRSSSSSVRSTMAPS